MTRSPRRGEGGLAADCGGRLRRVSTWGLVVVVRHEPAQRRQVHGPRLEELGVGLKRQARVGRGSSPASSHPSFAPRLAGLVAGLLSSPGSWLVPGAGLVVARGLDAACGARGVVRLAQHAGDLICSAECLLYARREESRGLVRPLVRAPPRFPCRARRRRLPGWSRVPGSSSPASRAWRLVVVARVRAAMRRLVVVAGFACVPPCGDLSSSPASRACRHAAACRRRRFACVPPCGDSSSSPASRACRHAATCRRRRLRVHAPCGGLSSSPASRAWRHAATCRRRRLRVRGAMRRLVVVGFSPPRRAGARPPPRSARCSRPASLHGPAHVGAGMPGLSSSSPASRACRHAATCRRRRLRVRGATRRLVVVGFSPPRRAGARPPPRSARCSRPASLHGPAHVGAGMPGLSSSSPALRLCRRRRARPRGTARVHPVDVILTRTAQFAPLFALGSRSRPSAPAPPSSPCGPSRCTPTCASASADAAAPPPAPQPRRRRRTGRLQLRRSAPAPRCRLRYALHLPAVARPAADGAGEPVPERSATRCAPAFARAGLCRSV